MAERTTQAIKNLQEVIQEMSTTNIRSQGLKVPVFETWILRLRKIYAQLEHTGEPTRDTAGSCSK